MVCPGTQNSCPRENICKFGQKCAKNCKKLQKMRIFCAKFAQISRKCKILKSMNLRLSIFFVARAFFDLCRPLVLRFFLAIFGHFSHFSGSRRKKCFLVFKSIFLALFCTPKFQTDGGGTFHFYRYRDHFLTFLPYPFCPLVRKSTENWKSPKILKKWVIPVHL